MTLVTLDLEFLGHPGVIAAYAARTPGGGFVLLECGPASTLPALERALGETGLDLEALRAVCVTHVHLDHAGAAGTLARRTGAPVYVHPAGAPHVADPGRLLASAARLYGDDMERLWGRTEGAPRELVRPVADGETLDLDGLAVTALHTPGHARHHVVWVVGGTVVTGDLAGIRFAGSRHPVPPTPPPDIDVGAWLDSLGRLRTVAPRGLALAHFGVHRDVERHLDALASRLGRWWEAALAVVREGGDLAALAARLEALEREELEREGEPPEVARLLARISPMTANAAGLFRTAGRALRSGGA